MNTERVKYYKEKYPKGTRIILDHMGDDPRPIESGTKGTVNFVDDMGTLHCTFDNGRALGVCPNVDCFHVITEPEEMQETNMSEPQITM